MVLANGLAIALSIMEYIAHEQKWEDLEKELEKLEKKQLDYKTAMFTVSERELVCARRHQGSLADYQH